MQEWEEKIIEKRKAREEGLAEGRSEGRSENKLLQEQIRKKLLKGHTPEEIADALEMDLSIIQKVISHLETSTPED